MTTPLAVLVACGGALGALARYGVATLAVRWGGGLPWGTWIVNALGCLAVGVVLAVPVADRMRAFAVVGFLGAFTTFSAYSADTVALCTAGRPLAAVGNALGSIVVGLGCTLAGIALGRALA